MKKIYLGPTTECVQFENEVVMNIVVGSQVQAGTGEGEGDGEDLINARRGEWGNVWKK